MTLPTSADENNPLGQGYWEAEGAPHVDTTEGFTEVTFNGAITVLQATTSGETISFHMDGEFLVIWRIVFNSASAAMEVCIGENCHNVSNFYATAGLQPVSFRVDPDVYEVTITSVTGNLQVDAWMVLSSVPEFEGGGDPPEIGDVIVIQYPWPERYYDQVGDRIVALDYRISAGEVAIVFLLAGLLTIQLIQFVVALWKP